MDEEAGKREAELRAQEAEKEGKERGMERGMKRGIEQGKKTGKKIGEQIGREIGKKEGERKTKELITQRLLANGEDVQQIMEITDLTKRSEEHTSELQSRFDIVCRLLLEKKKN